MLPRLRARKSLRRVRDGCLTMGTLHAGYRAQLLNDLEQDAAYDKQAKQKETTRRSLAEVGVPVRIVKKIAR